MTTITIGANVTDIQASAFEGCSHLTEIVVGEENEYYTSIDGNLYSKNKDVILQYPSGKTATEFTIPDSVTTIGVSAFAWNESLIRVNMGDSIEKIEDTAFYWCDGLTSVTVPDSVTEIGDAVFSWCDSLENLTIGAGAVKLGKELVKHSEKIKSITFQVVDEWYCTSNSAYAGGERIDVSNSSQNATCFLGANGDNYWYKK